MTPRGRMRLAIALCALWVAILGVSIYALIACVADGDPDHAIAAGAAIVGVAFPLDFFYRQARAWGEIARRARPVTISRPPRRPPGGWN